ncbi:MAG: hypothetical protein QOE90_3345 [Thermoplasmata archaeon]|nr:hypothetical protein [Thermoplasmata archaeon]
MIARVGVALGLLALVALAAWARARRRAGFQPRLARVPEDLVPPGAPLAVLYFTSRLCSECAETPHVVREAAPEVPAIAVSVHERARLARDLGVTETPTLLLVDAEGRIRYAQAGNPTPAQLWTYVREAWDSLDAEGQLARDAAN